MKQWNSINGQLHILFNPTTFWSWSVWLPSSIHSLNTRSSPPMWQGLRGNYGFARGALSRSGIFCIDGLQPQQWTDFSSFISVRRPIQSTTPKQKPTQRVVLGDRYGSSSNSFGKLAQIIRGKRKIPILLLFYCCFSFSRSLYRITVYCSKLPESEILSWVVHVTLEFSQWTASHLIQSNAFFITALKKRLPVCLIQAPPAVSIKHATWQQ